MKRYLVGAGIVILIAALGFAFGRYSAPEKIKEVEKIKIVEVEKIHQDSRENRDVTTVVTTKPDGTTTTETHDTTVVTTTTDSKTDTLATSEKTKTVTYHRPDWKVGALVGTDLSGFNFKNTLVYGGTIERRILGPIYIGGFGVSNGTVGITVSFEF